MNFKDTEDKQLEEDLKKALKNKEFRLYYQPKVNLISGKVLGVEALIRWQHPEKGIISPVEFISVAEETNLILPIGEWVIRTACLQNKAWQEMGLPALNMAVNLSARQLYQPNLVEMVRAILEETQLGPEYLELEITESMMMDVDHVLPIITELKKIGVKLSLDDFGTGYSSLYFLKEFPIDKIKIDQSFVRTCTTDMKDATIVKTIIAMAHQLKLLVIAEGVETKAQMIFLQESLCNIAQGYLFSKPVPPEELEQNFLNIEKIAKREGIPQEVGRQKWLEEQLEQARQELQETVRQQQGMIFKVIKENGVFIYTLFDGEMMYQFGWTPKQVVGRGVHDFFPQEDAERLLQYYQQAWNGEEKVVYELEFQNTWILTSLRPIRKGGKVTEIIGSSIDITKRKKMEESLRLSELNFRAIAENTEDLISILEKDGLVRYASPSHETLLGFSPGVYVGNKVSDWIHPDDIADVQRQLSEIFKTKTSRQQQFRYKNAQGGWVVLDARGKPVLDERGEIEYIVVISRDVAEITKTDDEKCTSLTPRTNIIEKDQLERDLEESRRNLAHINYALDESSIVAITDQRGIIEFINDRFCEVSKYSKMELIRKDHRVLNSGYHPKEFFENMWTTISNGKTWRGDIRNKAKDGRFYWVHTTIVPFLNNDGRPYRYVSIRTEITERKQIEEALRKSEERYQLISENTTDLICMIDWDGRFEYASPSHKFILGFPCEVYDGRYVKEWMHPDDFIPVRRSLTEMIDFKENRVFDYRLRDINDHWRWLEGKATPIFTEDGQFKHFIVVSREITERKMYEDKLAHMAFHDSLTDLPNRRLFKEKLNQSLKEAERYKRKMAVMYLDMDKFKHINDTLGHDVGDELLIQFAKRTLGCLRESDTLARQGGDEFTILLPEIREEGDAISIASRIIEDLREPWQIGDHIFKTTSSIGIAFYPNDGTNRYELLGNADAALFVAKESGRNNYKLFSSIGDNHEM